MVFSLSVALGHRLKSLFSREYFALSINTEKGRACASIILHQLIPSSSLGDSQKKYFLRVWYESMEATEKAAERSETDLSFRSSSKYGGKIVLGSACSIMSRDLWRASLMRRCPSSSDLAAMVFRRSVYRWICDLILPFFNAIDLSTLLCVFVGFNAWKIPSSTFLCRDWLESTCWVLVVKYYLYEATGN